VDSKGLSLQGNVYIQVLYNHGVSVSCSVTTIDIPFCLTLTLVGSCDMSFQRSGCVVRVVLLRQMRRGLRHDGLKRMVIGKSETQKSLLWCEKMIAKAAKEPVDGLLTTSSRSFGEFALRHGS
jgi:hypothetical protein